MGVGVFGMGAVDWIDCSGLAFADLATGRLFWIRGCPGFRDGKFGREDFGKEGRGDGWDGGGGRGG